MTWYLTIHVHFLYNRKVILSYYINAIIASPQRFSPYSRKLKSGKNKLKKNQRFFLFALIIILLHIDKFHHQFSIYIFFKFLSFLEKYQHLIHISTLFSYYYYKVHFCTLERIMKYGKNISL